MQADSTKHLITKTRVLPNYCTDQQYPENTNV